jgi:DNA-binding NtrC family response regulator
MAQADGCKAEAARLLGVHRKSVHRRVSELGTPNRSIPS